MQRTLKDLKTLPFVVQPAASIHPVIFSLYNKWIPNSSKIDKVYQGGEYINLGARTGSVKAEILTDIGLNSVNVVRTKTDSHLYFHLWEMVWTNKVENPLYHDDYIKSAVQSVTWGIGARVLFTCWDIKGDVNFSSPKGIAASAHASYAQTHFDVDLLGADPAALKIFEPLLIKSGSKFSMEELPLLENAQRDLATYFNNKEVQKRLIPTVMSVDVDPDRLHWGRKEYTDFKAVLTAESYAMERGSRNESYREAMALSNSHPNHYHKAKLSDDHLLEVYKEYWHAEHEDSKPEDEALMQASWDRLSVGR